MAREFIAIPDQTVEPNADVLFGNGGYFQGIFHVGGSGLFKLASPNVAGINNICPNRGFPIANYPVSFHGNIYIPTGGTVEEISLALVQDGVVDASSQMLATPAAVEVAENVGTGIIVSVPWICRCANVALRNTSTQSIVIQNGVLVINNPAFGFLREGVL